MIVAVDEEASTILMDDFHCPGVAEECSDMHERATVIVYHGT